MSRGCYLCLKDFLDQYEAASPDERRDPEAAKTASDGALLLLARSAELSFPVDSEYELATRLIRHSGHDVELWRLLTAVVKSLPKDANGVGEESALQQRRPDSKTLTTWRDALRQHRNESLVSAYVYLSAECTFSFPERPQPATIDSRFSETPLIMYRLATCGQTGQPSVQFRLFNRDQQFYELAYFIGEASAAQDREATTWYEAAVAHLPLFTAARVALAQALLEHEEYENALVAVEPVVTLVPEHHLATLVRVQALTGLGRHQEALDSLAPLLSSSWHLGDAYYFKALNEYSERVGAGDAVLADCAKALEYGPQARAFLLQGAQYLQRQDWESARRSFDKAVELQPENCAALNYLGRTAAGQGDVKRARAGFERAHRCYDERLQQVDDEVRKRVANVYLWPATADDDAHRSLARLGAKREQLSRLRALTETEMQAASADTSR